MSSVKVIASQSVIWLVVALFLVLLPEPLLGFFGTSHTAFTVTLARIFGSELTGLALVSWITRDTADPRKHNALLLSYFICNSLGFIVCLLGRRAGALKEAGWALVALYLVYALLFAYLRFMRPRRADG
jgi:hypothetical protein